MYEEDQISGLRVLEVPGHSPDSVIFYDEETQWQFEGDLVLKTGSTNALIELDNQLQLLPTVAQYEASLKRCRELPTSMVFAGHQMPFANHEEIIDKNLVRISKKCKRVVDAVEEGYHRVSEIASILYGGKLEKEFSLVMSEVIGYLNYAHMLGKLSKTKQDGEWYFKRK